MTGDPTTHDLADQRTSAPYATRLNHWNNHVERHAHAVPDRPALRFEGRTTTWRELRDRVRSLADALARRGTSPGDRVAVLMTNRPEFVEVVLAVNRLGAIAVPVNFRLTAPEVAYVLEHSGATLVFVDEVTLALARQTVTRLDAPVRVVALGQHDAQEHGAQDVEDLETLLAEQGATAPAVDVAEDAPALIMYTSGTTGRPKGAVLTHQNLQCQALTLVRAFQLCGDDEVNLVAAPLFHIGAVGSVAPLLLIGGTLVISPSGAFEAAAVLDLLEQERVTSAFLVPTQWQALCADPGLPARDLRALRVTSWGAAPAPDTLLRRMADAFPDSLNVAVFGQTEMSPVTCVLDGRDALRKLGSVGRPVASVWARVVDDEMRDVVSGQVGEIVYQGPTLMQGYWRDPQATAEAFAGGWFHSGDLVRVDEEGFLFVVDRAKDMIISGGENVYCAEVENVLAGHPDIEQVAVVGRPHPTWGETPVAVVVLRDPSRSLTLEELRAWAGEHLARYKLPTGLEVVEELPRNASGKVLKGLLRQERSRAGT